MATTTPTTTPYTTTPPTTHYTAAPTICPYGYVRTPVSGVKVSMGRKNKRPLLVEVAPTGVDHEIMKIETSGDDKPDILSPVNIENMSPTKLNKHLKSIMPYKKRMTSVAMVFKSGYSIRKIKKMLSRKRVNGKRWYQIFPREDTYIYKAGDGSN